MYQSFDTVEEAWSYEVSQKGYDNLVRELHEEQQAAHAKGDMDDYDWITSSLKTLERMYHG